MPENRHHILLTTLNARYSHSAIGLRYIFANMRELQPESAIREFTINDNIQDIAEQLLAAQPKVIGIGVYIWNACECAELVQLIKQISPQTIVVLGGPEVSYLPLRLNFDAADYIVQGEGDAAFYDLAKALLGDLPPQQRTIQAPMPDLNTIELPYDYYTDADVANRYIYVEASRGCPFLCEFCLSSIDKKVRNIDTEQLLLALDKLYQRGVRSFKFIDRTFNLNVKIASRLLDFFLERQPCFVHFEVIPDHFPDALKERIARFPAAALQLEIGIQTLNTEVADRIHRNLKMDKIKENIRFLEEESSAHMHLDLIVGLPGETLDSFGDNLNRLCTMANSEIQIGILKKLSGTSLHRHDDEFGMIYSPKPPYDILKNDLLSFVDIQQMKRFSRFWNLYYNSGNFKQSIGLLWPAGDVYEQFGAFSLWVYQQTQSTWQISLDRLTALLFDYLCDKRGCNRGDVAALLIEDTMKLKGRKMPKCLQPFAYERSPEPLQSATGHNKRQIRHARVEQNGL
ncbi:B12-binding domain-containing radical SAM protein [Mariprofundus ferrooxydans]|uniref:Radical SAM n=1 Tax=Mariprofundus ferrooxydans PV-1 TaxID=314345 RepID=Q0EXI9_9PROT|nr:B12-binding domain-containing radical SAM protein [Mariprofundus ferrooxydans]EAU53927.1 Radical SAM [Mariprofundus ferrooxydans PV-1]KON47120.1 radical SAM protein [Mariprofundus ferrooxydans]